MTGPHAGSSPPAPKPGAHAHERRVILLGSTGSIGTQTVDVIEHLNALHARGAFPFRLRVVGLAAGSNIDALFAQARRLGVRDLALSKPGNAGSASTNSHLSTPEGPINLRLGPDSPEELVREVACDIVLGAMVGAAGLPATLAAVQLGRDVALANKETLVAAGALVVPAAQASGSRLLPVDSEHAGVWQCLQGVSDCGLRIAELKSEISNPKSEITLSCPPMACGDSVARVVLTASGGPFRTWTREATYRATPAQALNHPTWKMGPKVTIDSASLTNKALEVIEAHWLFGLPGDKIDVLVHPQSIVHALVEYADGNVIAQMGPPDMRSPIQYALTFPLRPDGRSHKMNFAALSKLEFSPPDREQFPALDAAYEIIARGGTAGAVFNAANEAAVEAFLAADGALPFGRIAELSRQALKEVGVSPLRTLADAMDADAEARRFVRAVLKPAAHAGSVA